MVKFLINRPIAVIMIYIAAIVTGLISYYRLPVSIMPDVAIPEISVQLSYPNASANEIESAIVSPLKNKLIQLSHLKNIECKSRNSNALIQLTFEYGTNIDYAFIETNEKIDAAMQNLPGDMQRPRAVKASATDIPVFYLNVSLKEHSNEKFFELSEFCENVIKRHIEQLPQVAMTDMSGQLSPQILIQPNSEQIKSMGITITQIEAALKQNNVAFGNLLIRDGYYQYYLSFSDVLHSVDEIRNIYIKTTDRLIQLKDIAEIQQVPQKIRGMAYAQNKPSISLAVIKQADARMEEMKDELRQLTDYFKTQYPELEFDVSQDQTRLLEYSISNLQSSLLTGVALVFVIILLFLGNIKASLLTGLTIPVSLIIVFLFFFLSGLSINIISLSGLILAVGMMIDNAIIVIDNINQHYERNKNFEQACISATNEVIRPLLSSALTTCAIFLPMIFLSGISGALFFDQAVTVTIGLGVSYIVSITLIPVLYYNIFRRNPEKQIAGKGQKLKKYSAFRSVEQLYDKGFNITFGYKLPFFIAFMLLIPLSVVLFNVLDKEKLPAITQTETLVSIDWNENIRVEENQNRLTAMLTAVNNQLLQQNAFVGEQQFILNTDYDLSMSEAVIYLQTASETNLRAVKKHINSYMQQKYPQASLKLMPPPSIFEKLFSSDEVELQARISASNKDTELKPEEIAQLADSLDLITNNKLRNNIPLNQYISIEIDMERLLIYNVDYSTLVKQLKTAFNEYDAGSLKTTGRFIPLILGEKEKPFNEIIQNLFVENNNKEAIAVKSLIKITKGKTFKTIASDNNGTYAGLNFSVENQNYAATMQQIQSFVNPLKKYDLSFVGSIFSRKLMFSELLVVLGVSLLLLYFILAAQFESVVQPIIVLIEIPVDICGALFMLWLFGASVNIMAMIGIVVMCGIVINDSILKIDTINQLRSP